VTQHLLICYECDGVAKDGQLRGVPKNSLLLKNY